jgi:hypothetical protein
MKPMRDNKYGDIVIQQGDDEVYTAYVIGYPEMNREGKTPAEALRKVNVALYWARDNKRKAETARTDAVRKASEDLDAIFTGKKKKKWWLF